MNEFRFGYVRINYGLMNVPPVTAADLGIDRPMNNLTDSHLQVYFAITSGFQIGPTPPANQYQTQNNFNFVDNVSWVKGAHVLRFGAEVTRVNLNKLFPQTFNGQIFFTNSPDGLTDWQNFLEGAPAIQLRWRRSVQPPVPRNGLRILCPGRLESEEEPHIESGVAHGNQRSVQRQSLPHRQHRRKPGCAKPLSDDLWRLRQ